jgi:hypothetical protein
MDEVLDRVDLEEGIEALREADAEGFLLIYVTDNELKYRTNLTNAEYIYFLEQMIHAHFNDDVVD